ncbi:cation:proton antiporter [Allostella vacuolata]|nr:cation:proton antiporter [Stella vacuolata]
MSRILPYPALAAALLVMWLLLNQSVAPGQMLLGSIVGVLAALAMAALRPEKPRIRRLGLVLRLVALVTIDVARSNLAVARIVLAGGRREQTSAFLHVPLRLTDRHGLAVLACIVTATPGSAWLEYSPARSCVLIHVLDLIDEQQWIDTLTNRYETLLLEIFQ